MVMPLFVCWSYGTNPLNYQGGSHSLKFSETLAVCCGVRNFRVDSYVMGPVNSWSFAHSQACSAVKWAPGSSEILCRIHIVGSYILQTLS